MGWLTNLFKLGSSKGSESNIQADVTLYAPVTGTLLPLDEVPDIVISEKVMGDGVAIVPESDLIVSPCDGVISRFLPTKHAFAVRQDNGLEVYVSFGLEAMEVLGEGFTALSSVGDAVKKGDGVLKVDVNFLGSKLKSLITSMIVIKSSGDIDRVTAASGQCKAGETEAVWIALKDSAKAGVAGDATSEASEDSEESQDSSEISEAHEQVASSYNSADSSTAEVANTDSSNNAPSSEVVDNTVSYATSATPATSATSDSSGSITDTVNSAETITPEKDASVEESASVMGGENDEVVAVGEVGDSLEGKVVPENAENTEQADSQDKAGAKQD